MQPPFLNWRANTYAQPGYASGLDPDTNCDDITHAAIRDGLTTIEADTECKACGHKVALVIDPNWPDYHWYRKDRNGMWSHKGGGGPASNLDYSDNTIADPRNADRRGNGGLNYVVSSVHTREM